MHNYHDRIGQLPPGYLSTLNGPPVRVRTLTAHGTRLVRGWGWAAFLLGDLEQTTLQSDHPLRPSDRGSNQCTPRTTTVPTFVCPSEVMTGTFFVVDSSGNALVRSLIAVMPPSMVYSASRQTHSTTMASFSGMAKCD